jgi:hypothetical protein
MMTINVTSPRRVVIDRGSGYLDGHVPPWRTLDFCGHRISIADSDRFPSTTHADGLSAVTGGSPS